MIDYSKVLNEQIQQVKPSGIRKFFDIAAEMDDVISLSIGEPDFPTPWHVRQAGVECIEKGKTFYSPNRGFSELCSEITKWNERKYGISYDPSSEIYVSVGGSEAIDTFLRAVVNPGDEVLVPDPSFVCYAPLTQMCGGVPISVPTCEKDSFKLTAQSLRDAITDKTKVLIFPFPNNPTGSVMRRDELEEIASVIRETNILVLSDEIYAELTYGDCPHISISSIEGMKERTVVVSGFSKTYAMTGWRLGYAMGPEEIISPMMKIHQYGIMSSPTMSQLAAIEALKNGDLDIVNMRGEYDTRRRYLLSELRKMGLDCFEPEGAFYVFPSIKSTGLTSEDFCTRLLVDQHVAVIPGTAFGDCGEGFIRISYSYSLKHITEALERMKRFIATL